MIPTSVLVAVAVLVSGCAGAPLNKPQITEPCPETPNCVSSIDSDDTHGIEPFAFKGQDAEAAWKAMLLALNMEKRVSIIKDTGSYLYAESRTFLGFVDDVEFMAEPQANLLHVRSASRVGYWDLGVNGRRVDRIRDRYTEILKTQIQENK